MKEEDNMTKEVIWGVLVLALILTTYLSHVEDRRHKEVMAKLEARKLEIQARMRELDDELAEINAEYERKMAESNENYERKLAELDKAHAERIREIDDKLAAAAKTEGVDTDGHAE